MSALTIETVREHVIGIDTEVPILDGSTVRYVNLDNAATTPPLRPVLETVNEFLRWYASVERGAGFKSRVSTAAYAEARRIVGRFVGADPDAYTVVFIRNSTEAINKLAHRFPFSPGDIVLRSLMEHHSNDLPWRLVADVDYIEVNAAGGLDLDHFEYLLNKYGERVKLVAISGASNVTGYLNPIHAIAARAHAAGAKILVDAAQLAPHRRIAMGDPDDPEHIDYLAFSAHKMYAPYGTGVLVGLNETFARGTPDCVGGGTIELVTADQVRWAHLPEREEAGTPNAVGAIALAAAIAALEEIGFAAIAAHEARLTSRLLRGLERIDGVKVYGDRNPDRTEERLGVVPFAVEGVPHQLVAAVLAFEGGIGVRNGCFCAHPYVLRLLGVSPAEIERYQAEVARGSRVNLPGLVRASFGVYNDESDVDALLEWVERIARREYRGDYVQDEATGEFVPRGGPPGFERYFSLR